MDRREQDLRHEAITDISIPGREYPIVSASTCGLLIAGGDVTMPVDILLRMAFDSGYEAGADDAAAVNCWSRPGICKGRSATGGKTERAVAMGEVAMAVSVATLEHEEDCRCGLFRALRAVEG